MSMLLLRVTRVVLYQNLIKEPLKQDALAGQHPDPGEAPHAVPILIEVHLPGLPVTTE